LRQGMICVAFDLSFPTYLRITTQALL
jgi:hypothetical protein